jgi:hypothetical protein
MSSNRSRRNLFWFPSLVGAILTVWITGGSAQSGLALALLTVPEAKLPDGCKLMPYVPPATQVVQAGATTTIRPTFGNSHPFPGNPWSGTDPKLEATVRGSIDNTHARVVLTDVPISGSGRPAVSPPKPPDNILEAYRAAYVWAVDGHQVQVSAVTFNDVKLAAAPESLSALLNPPRQFSRRLVRGATAIRVSASSENACFKSVVAYVESLK